MQRLATLTSLLAAMGQGLVQADDLPQPPWPVKVQIVPGHPWRPPFGLERVGRPPDVLATYLGEGQPQGKFLLVTYRRGNEVNRQGVTWVNQPSAPIMARLALEDEASEIALLHSPTGGEYVEWSRQAVTFTPPPLEAEAVAWPDKLVHPVDLGVIFPPANWLLLAGGQQANVEVLALLRGLDSPTARVTTWYESAPEEKATVAMPLIAGRKTRATLNAGPGARGQTQDVLHVELADAAGRALWQKAIRVMRVPEAPRFPRFGAVATKLRYDPPIPTSYQPGRINYDEGWDPKLDDVVVFFPNGARFVFWRGASYCPFWASRSNTGLSYEWAEVLSGHGIAGANDCVEPLQDKELRYGRVEIVESTPARVHLRWRYQSCDLDYKVGGSFAVEDYYFYPDGFGTRVLTLTADPRSSVETTEFIIFTPQSAYPFEFLSEKLLDVIWPDGKAEFRFPCLRDGQQEQWAKLQTAREPLMHRIRFGKQDALAAICYSPWGSGQDLPGFPPFTDGGAIVTPMYWGSHWPLSRGYPTRYAISDRIHASPGHNSMFHAGTPQPLRTRTAEMPDAQGELKTLKQETWVWLVGMTDANDETLRRWIKSFALQPPTLDLAGARPSAEPYSPERRALRLIVEKPVVTFALKPAGHCVNPVFELSGAPQTLTRVSLDGRPLVSARHAWDGQTLWLEMTLSQAARLKLEFAEADR
jgi:hypothetical protein